MAPYALPEFVAFQSKYNKKYLQYVHQDGDLHGFLQFSGDEVVSPYTKFQVLVSGSDSNLVHLQSCYNNKFWAPSEQNDNWILAEVDTPDDSTTLLEPTFRDAKTVRLSHVKLGKFVTLMNEPGQARDACLYPLSSELRDQELTELFTVIDWSSLLILPRNVAFKGGPEGKLLGARPVNNVRYLQFVTDDVSDPTAGHEVFISGDGNISLKSDFYEKFWTRSSNSWILADEVSTNGINTLFSPVTIQENVVALRSLGNNNYCKSVSANDTTTKESIIALSATDASITKMSHLEVVDRVMSKNVTVEASDFRVSDSRTFGGGDIVVIASGEAYNYDTKKTLVTKIKLNYNRQLYTNIWNSTVNGSLKVGDTVGINSPTTISYGKDNMSLESEMIGNIVWGEEVVVKKVYPKDEDYQVTLPPMYMATVKVKGGRIPWDVPFSYTQTNTLFDGTVTSFKMDDGTQSGTSTIYLGTYDVDVIPIV